MYENVTICSKLNTESKILMHAGNLSILGQTEEEDLIRTDLELDHIE